MKIISCIGIGNYQTTTYTWSRPGEPVSCTTRLFPEALVEIFQPEKLLVFVTAKARADQNYRDLQKCLGDRFQGVEIPDGSSEQEIWQIFDQYVQAVDLGDDVILDVTHGFRSLPMLIFAVASYLRRVKQVRICHILYGAYEARNDDNISPIFDLTPMADLMDWLSGAETLTLRSDAELFARKLKEAHRYPWLRHGDREDSPRALGIIADKLNAFSRSIHLARPLDVMRTAGEILPLLERATTEADAWAKPFREVLAQVRDELKPLARSNPEQLDRDNLSCQLEIISHCQRKNLVMQAITMAREWIVSMVLLKHNTGDWLERSCRYPAEHALGAAMQLAQGKEAEVFAWFEQLSGKAQLCNTWDWLSELRNEVAHCGMNRQGTAVTKIEQRAQEISQRLQELLNDLPAVASI